jgi:hypothetical protein
MPIKVTCACGKVTNVPDAYAGRTGKCPACKQPVKVPMLEAATAPVYEDAPTPQMRAAPEAPIRTAPAPQMRQAPPPQYHEPEPEPAYEPEHEPEQEYSSVREPAVDEQPYDVSESAPPPDAPESAAADHEPGAMVAASGGAVQVPTDLPQKLRQPNCPPLFLVISTAGADVKAKFDTSPVLVAFVESFAKSMKKKFDVRLDPPADDSAPIVTVHVAGIKSGSRALRFLFAWLGMLFGASTIFEVNGHVQAPSKEPAPFTFKARRNVSMIFGGSSLGLLKRNARSVAGKVAGLARQAA